jgi:hypothetical protein
MFPGPYFAPRYFAARYFPEVGAVVIVSPSIHRIFRPGPTAAGGDLLRGSANAAGSSTFRGTAGGAAKLWR